MFVQILLYFLWCLVNQAQQFMCFCFVNKQQVFVECGQSKKVLAVSGDYISLQRILKEAFGIDREIIIQKYEADWEDFVDLVDFVDVQDRWGTLN